MYASGVSNAVIALAAFCFSNAVTAGPITPKDFTEPALDPWVSVDASGVAVSTITPALTTISGTPTTIGAVPATLTATTTSPPSDSKPTETSVSTGGGSYQVCNNLDQEYAPFCKPDNGTAVWVDNTYYVTWDINFFSEKNATLLLIANYVNISDGSGAIAFTSPIIGAQQGFYAWTIDKAWMKGLPSNNITLFINPIVPINGQAQSFEGPTLMVANKPATYYQQPHTKAPEGQSLYIALPTVFGFILVCVFGTFIINRKQRRIGLGNVMGRRNGYGVGKSRTQRMGQGKKKTAIIALREQELAEGGQYRDKPEESTMDRGRDGHARADSDALGSLAGSIKEDNYFETQKAHGLGQQHAF